MWPTWVRSRDDSSATVGRIDMGSTRVGGELIGLANAGSVKYLRAPRALPRALSLKNRVFRSFFQDCRWYSETMGLDDLKPTQFSRGMYRL